jgi:uncharacterized membrane-anchored protein YitT (DUF2179 family)
MFLFPISKGRKARLLVVIAKRPYDHNELTKKVLNHSSKLKEGMNYYSSTKKNPIAIMT